MHRKFWQAFKVLAPITPFMFLKNPQMAEEEEDKSLTSELETHINKIFLTPDIS